MHERTLNIAINVDADEMAALEKSAKETGWPVHDYVRLLALTVTVERLPQPIDKPRAWHVVFLVNAKEKEVLEDLAAGAGFVHAADYVREMALNVRMPVGLKCGPAGEVLAGSY